ncbi:MAG: chromosome segregation SMC family protein [Solirubrobacteraceae bacterium]
MYLKSITLKGFKSFPDRTRLEFGPGISVIVGPNGSGKSNVTDAVLWALGEQSPVAVRGQSMQDVIFGGTAGRQAATGAEVELVLDDSDGVLGLGSPEVSILRRLDRTGEGEYRLNGARCRLVEVIELLSDTGMGKEMHSVISQGRVESIVTSKPRERRLLIEEAAGLGKHRKRRRRAQLKLARTQDNLDRALDVEREARSRLRPLKRQAEAAELHARLERQSLEARWELARDELRRRRSTQADAETAAAAARQRRAEIEAALARVASRREQAEEALAQRSSHREELSRRCFRAGAAAERVEDRAQGVRSAISALQSHAERTHAVLQALESAAGADVPDADEPQRLAALEAELEVLERDCEAELDRALAKLADRLKRAGAQTARLDDSVEQAAAERRDSELRLEEARLALREAERRVEHARREGARVGGELAAVNQFIRSQSTLPGSAPSLADELEVQPGYELALAAALDGRLRAAVVEDRQAAGRLLDRAAQDGGRAFVRGAGAVGRSDASGAAGGSSPGAGAVRLTDLVRGPERSLAIARELLSDTWVVEALEGLPDGFGGIAVTRSGRAWSARLLELRQAPEGGGERLLAERNRREQLIAASEAAASEELAAAQGLAARTQELSQVEAPRERALERHRAALRSRDEAAEDARRLQALIERRRSAPDESPGAGRRAQLSAQLGSARQALERAERERLQREAQIQRLRDAIARAAEALPVMEELLGALLGAAGAITAQAARFEADLTADRRADDELGAALRACAQEEAELHAGLHRGSEVLTAAEVALQRAKDQLRDTETELAGLSSLLGLEVAGAAQELEESERLALSDRIARLARRREQLGPVNPLAQEEYAEAVAHVEELEHQRGDLETALRELQKLISDTDRQIRETFEETFQAAARNFEELAAQLFPGGRGRLRLVAEREGSPRVLGAHEMSADADADGAGAELEAIGEPEEELLGVEIEITPAGKECKRLTLLSGGEKSMTALAFLFSVFLARPCPFYILDEVEAALDDLNIDRFLALLRQYCERAQFIVVTHQKRTMEAADSLYGVSMGGDGISKVISRRLPREELAA